MARSIGLYKANTDSIYLHTDHYFKHCIQTLYSNVQKVCMSHAMY